MKPQRIPLLLLAIAMFFPLHSAIPQGSLTPPGAPMPTMKALDEIEPRTAIKSLPLTISVPGSYYLTRNLMATGAGGGITVSADNVTIDLRGFALIGGGGGAVAGILVPAPQKNLCVRNGTVRGWTDGGIRAGNASNSLFEKLRVSDNGGDLPDAGLLVGAGCVVRDCVAANNAGIFGFRSPDGSVFIGCIATGNGNRGFSLGNNINISNCTASGNTDRGIVVGANSTVIQCTATDNGSVGIEASNGCTVADSTSGNNLVGFYVNFGCTIRNCTARDNFEGIDVTGGCHVLNNTADLNSATAFNIIGSSNRVEGNTATTNFQGFLFQDKNNLVVRNSARGNTFNYQFNVPGNAVGTIFDVSAGATISTHEAWANYVF